MKVILDANVLLSYLLSPDPTLTIAQVVEACFFRAGITLLGPLELIRETQEKALTKRYFKNKISPDVVESFLSLLVTQGEIPPEWQGLMGRYGKDRKDDYLIAYALFHNVDYLVTGDRHLLALRQIEQRQIEQRQIEQLQILLPAAMLEIIRTQFK